MMSKVSVGWSGWATVAIVAMAASASWAQKEVTKDPITPGVGEARPELTETELVVQLEEAAIQAIASSQAFDSARLMVEHSAVAHYSTLGITGFSYKVIDEDGSSYGIMLDAAGHELDPASLETAEQEAYASVYGKLHPALIDELPFVEADQQVPVIIWLREEGEQPLAQRPPANFPMSLSKELEQATFEAADSVRTTYVEAIARPLATELESLGYVVGTDAFAPVIYSSLEPSAITELSRRADIDTIYLDDVNEPNLSIARQVIRANTVNSRGITGSGVRVGVIEVGGRVQNVNPLTHPFLAGATQDFTDSCVSSHATAVAGIIRSTHPVDRGISPSSILWVGGSCGGVSAQLQNAATRAANFGCRVLNNSWGATGANNLAALRVPNANARFFDNLVLTRWRTAIVSAGNRGSAGCNNNAANDAFVTNPAIAYNVIAVGMTDDDNTVSTAGDNMHVCSSFVDPTSAHSDREKPEVAAPGTAIRTALNAAPFIGGSFSGTSASGPMVAGEAALLIDRNGSLAVWPESVKAIIMATALQNIEGASRLSEKDGAGQINCDRADDVARGVNGSWGGVLYDCTSNTPDPWEVFTMSLTAGKRVRVAIAWNTDTAYSNYTTQPSADIDLRIVRANGAVVASSASFDNTYEIVDFVVPATDQYHIRINRFRCSRSPQHLGWAWYQRP